MTRTLKDSKKSVAKDSPKKSIKKEVKKESIKRHSTLKLPALKRITTNAGIQACQRQVPECMRRTVELEIDRKISIATSFAKRRGMVTITEDDIVRAIEMDNRTRLVKV